jgi:threonine aldolase
LVSTTAIAIENTHNFGGGTVQPLDEIKKLRQESQALGIALHLDGARIWNAHIASGVEFKEYGKYFDTISVCLSKGLGAPVGSLMLSTKDRVIKARAWRKRYGGGMRQAGILAAAAHYALDNNLALLKNDHKRAKEIAIAIAAVAPKVINPDHVETNIVGLDISSMKITAAQLSEQLKASGVLASALGPKYLRVVTHLDLTDADIEKVNLVLPQLLQRALVS